MFRALSAATLLLVMLQQLADAAWINTPDGKRLFVRAVVYSPHHPKHATDLPAPVRARDQQLVRGLNANCVLRLEPVNYAELEAWHQQGVYSLPQVPYEPLEATAFVNGQTAPIPSYVSRTNRDGLFSAARDFASALKGNPGLLGVSLGSSYSWTAFSGDLGGFAYGGFDDATVEAYQQWLKDRFGTFSAFQELTLVDAAGFGEMLPARALDNSPSFYEWWLFMDQAFSEYLKRGYEGLRAVGLEAPALYQQPYGLRWDPASEGAHLPYTEVVAANAFFPDGLDWRNYCIALDRTVAQAGGRPVLLTQTGVETLTRSPEVQRSILERSIALALLHPEIAGVGIYEFCDGWERAGKPDVHDNRDDREHWGLVTGTREPKPLYGVVRSLFAMLERNESLLQEWQSPPDVLLGCQEVDWWRVRGPAATNYQRVATELYRLGVSFRLTDSASLRDIDPRHHPLLVLCDRFLPSDPAHTPGLLGHVVSYVERGGKLLYLSPTPWQPLYGSFTPPVELTPPADGSPATRPYGAGSCTLVSAAELTDREMHYFVQEFVAEAISRKLVTALRPQGVGEGPVPEVYWRMYESQESHWLYAVNLGSIPAPRLELALGDDVSPRRLSMRESDGAGLAITGKAAYLTGLRTYALIEIKRQ